MMDRILLGGKGVLLRSLPPRAAPLAGLTAELNTQAAEGRKVLSWFSESGKKPDVTRAGERLRGLRGHGVSNTVTGLPISERSRSRWPLREDTTMAAGWPEAGGRQA